MFLFVLLILILFFCKFDLAEFPLMVQFYTNMYQTYMITHQNW